jgi:hypothetical protein
MQNQLKVFRDERGLDLRPDGFEYFKINTRSGMRIRMKVRAIDFQEFLKSGLKTLKTPKYIDRMRAKGYPLL